MRKLFGPTPWLLALLVASSGCSEAETLPMVDAGPRDAGFVFPDASFGLDAQSWPDANGDAAVVDLGGVDLGVPDAGQPDSGPADSGPADTGEPSSCGLARLPELTDLIVNEFLADPGPDLENGDANLDGVRNATDDEFIEIANVSEDDLLLEDVTIQDAAGVIRHTFGSLILGCGQVIVVFGGGDDQAVDWPLEWVVADSGGLSLNNDADEIRLGFASGTADELGVTSYGAEANVDQSLVRDPELDGESPFVPHTSVADAEGAAFSPGTRVDGTSVR